MMIFIKLNFAFFSSLQGSSKTSTMITSTHTRAVGSSLSSLASSCLQGWDSTIVCWTKRRKRRREGSGWEVENKSPTVTLSKTHQGLETQRRLSNVVYQVTFYPILCCLWGMFMENTDAWVRQC